MPVPFPRFSLFERHNGMYSILYYHNGLRRWKSTGATTKPEALKALSRFQELLEERPNPVPLRQFVSDFLSFAASSYAPKTLDIFRRVLPHFQHSVGDLYLFELTPEHFDRFKAARLKSVSPVSANIELRAIRSAIATA